ncbi:WD repeat-containing protein 90 isoform X3 [Neofelis nebulosa]|uniref:WD repeat-containing protein 90 isoform X3 n=1 Tax=Neofelis nebulosa TaxID=61452 RepID=UPI00272AD1B9|nr:WD repeat-containing protein 90 isoform X3 [Neofelis nebulosa]
MAKAWQHPFLNVFRHFKVGEWKRSTKEGDVTPVTDKTLKCTVYRIRGSVSAGNYIQLPQTSTQSLGLTGRYLYVLFRPLPSKHFIIHLDVATEDSQVIRVSFSSLFREFKSTATWLQFPFICEAGTSRKDLAGVAPSGARWTCLQLDLQDILLVYLNRRYGHLKSVRLCASLLVKSLYTSDLCFDPAVTVAEARRAKLPVTPVPREMAFPVPKGDSWHEHYVHIRFPSVGSRASSEPAQKSRSPPEAVFRGRVRELVPPPVAFSNPFPDGVSPAVQMFGPTASRQARPVPRPLPEVSLFCEHSEVASMNGPRDRSQEPSARAEVTDKHTAGNGVHTAVPESAVVPVALEDVAPRQSFLPDPILKLKGVIGFGGHSTKWALWTKDGAAVVYPCHAVIVVLHVDTREQRFFLGHTDKLLQQRGAALWRRQGPPWENGNGPGLGGRGEDPHGRAVTGRGWGAGAQVESRLLGKQSSPARPRAPCTPCSTAGFQPSRTGAAFIRGTLSLLAVCYTSALRKSAASTGSRMLPRVCLCLWVGVRRFRRRARLRVSVEAAGYAHRPTCPHSWPPRAQAGWYGKGELRRRGGQAGWVGGLRALSTGLSQVVLAWGTEQVGRGGEAVLLAKTHTGVDIQAFKVAFFDETRMASCGQGGIRLWRLRGRELRSCPVDLGEHRVLELTDLAFGQAQDSHTLYVCGRSGHILEIDHRRRAVRRARRLLPTQTPGGHSSQKQPFGTGPGISISSLSVSQTTCAVGSDDGYVRLWPLDFSSVLLEAEHEGPVSWVCVSPDGLRVLSATLSGHLGFLDVPSREYNTLARSHTAPVLALATECSRGQLATVSQDHTVRVWDLATLQQLYDLRSPEETPRAIAFHPTQPVLFCGFASGAVCSFSLENAGVLVRHRRHQGAVTGLAASPDGSFLFSSCSRGTLAQYHCSTTRCRVLRVTANMVCRDAHPTPNALVVSGDSRLLAFVGPSKYVVTIVSTASLEELLRVDVSALELASSRLDSAVAICFGPVPPGHLLVSTSSHTVVVLDAASGRVVRELSGVHSVACPSLALSRDARFLLTATDRVIRVWDYLAKASPGCQVYIGHSEPVRAVAFAPGQRQLLSVADAIFLWDVLGAPGRSPSGSAGDSPGAPPTCEASPGARQPEDTEAGTGGLPRQQVPVPSQASPLQLGARAGPLKGADGAFSTSDEEGPSQESHSPEGLHQASSLPMLVKEASGAGDGARGAPGGPWGFSMRPHPCGWARGVSTTKAQARPSARPDCYRHFTARYKASSLVKSASVPSARVERLLLKAVVGYNGNGRANVVWKPDTGFFAYTCGCLVVVEDLHSGTQRHWLGHPEEISTLALSHDAQILASASGCSSTASCCQIRIWDVPGGSCRHLLSYHDTAVQALAFSPDDALLVTLGDYGDCTLALWSVATCELLSSARLPEPAHGVAFNPRDARELACVGQGAITSWLLQQRGAEVTLQVHREPVPEEVGAGELTSLCYGAAPLLYCGSNTGRVCVWDTRAGRCFLAWEADDGEIGVLLCSGARLVSGSNTRRLRLWAVGAVPELRRKGARARSSSVFMEHELTLDGAIVSAVFHDSMDMGVVGTTAGTLWYVSWAEGTSTRLISGHRSKVNEVVFSPSASHWATCSDDGSVRVWSLASMELLIRFQVLNQSCLCLAWSPPSCGRPEEQQVAAGYSDGTLRVFSVSHIAMELKLRPHRAALTAIAFSADGQTILSGDKDGLVAVSRPRTGMTFHVLSDHRGAPISAIQSTNKECGDLGAEGADLWLAASSDQRISIWASDWPRGHCELLDWLSSPSPTLTEFPSRPPPCLVAFCPWDGALLACAGLGMHPEVVFYSLHQKQARAPPPPPPHAVPGAGGIQGWGGEAHAHCPQVVERIPLPFFAVSLSLSPGAHLMAVGFAERMLRLVDCESGAVQDFAGHDDLVQLCRFAPSARLLFSVAHSEILVWEVSGHRATEESLGSGSWPAWRRS